MTEKISQVIEQILGDAANSLAQATSLKTLDDVTFHDFSKYEYLINPSTQRKLNLSPLSSAAVAYINDLESSGSSPEILEYMADLFIRFEANVRQACIDGVPEDLSSASRPNRIGPKLPDLGLTLNDLPSIILKPLYTTHRRLIRTIVDLDREIKDFFSFHLYNHIKSEAKGIALKLTNSIADGQVPYQKPLYDWVFIIEEINWHYITEDLEVDRVDLASDLEYPFEIFPPESVNVGIALIYRQRWKAIGTQPGEIVKTIPLGPGQSEKVVTKITRRRKSTSSTETMVESEISTDTSDTTKDSTEVVKEAASNQNWNISAQASYGVGGVGFGASASAEMGGSKSNSSKNTTSSLSEMMKKTASKIRRQTKVTVTTETETSFEGTTTSEVSNGNDEVALTLQYHMLQHQYDVYTYLFSVKNAIFVAERVPAPYEVTIKWVRRYDWIIAQELLDESFRGTLNELIQDEDVDALLEFEDNNDPYIRMMNQANNSFAKFDTPGNPNGLGGLDVKDIYAEPQRQYDQYRKNEETRRRTNKIRKIRRQRLLNHLRDNILHYCRAIWAREDAEQRMFRYKKEGRTVPFIWSGPLLQTFDNASQFQPTSIRVSIDQVIGDIVPIGFTGNYIVFALATPDFDTEDLIELSGDTPDGEIKLPLHEVLDIARSAYTDSSGTKLRDPAFDIFVSEAESLPPNALATLDDETVFDFISFLPKLESELVNQEMVLRNPDGTLQYVISTVEWAENLLKKNENRRFLVDSNNLYVSLLLGNGVALEPFKRAHRFIDVLRADEERKAEALKNERRDLLKNDVQLFDPDIAKVVIAGGTDVDDLIGGLIDDDN